MLQKVIFSYVRAIFFVFMYTVSTAENNSRDTVLKTLFLVFSIFLSIFEILHVFYYTLSVMNLVLGGVRLLSRIPYLRLSVYDTRNSSCIRRSLSLFYVFACQSSIPRQITRESDIIHTAIGCECNCCQMNRFLGKAAVSILSESLQLPPNNEFVTEE